MSKVSALSSIYKIVIIVHLEKTEPNVANVANVADVANVAKWYANGGQLQPPLKQMERNPNTDSMTLHPAVEVCEWVEGR